MLDGLHDLQVGPQLLVELLGTLPPLNVSLNLVRVAVLSWWWWEVAFVVLHLHQDSVDILNVTKSGLAVCNVAHALTVRAHFVLRSLEVEERSWRLGVAESDLAKTSFDNELLVLWSSLCGFNSALNLLFHALDVVVTATRVSTTTAKSATSLEEVSLGELIEGLMRVGPGSTPDLSVYLVVKVFGQLSISSLLVDTTSSSQELLELNASDKVLVLRRHEAIALGQQKDLVVALGSLCLFGEESEALLFGHLHHLVCLGDWWAAV